MSEEYQFSPSQNLIGRYNAQVYGSGSAIVNVYETIAPRPIDAATIRAAQQHLANLPLDIIPDIYPLPDHSRMPFAPNPLFVGRRADLKALAIILKGSEKNNGGPVPIAALTGLGGIGKTQLASEFVHRYGHYFSGGVFWLSFSDMNAIPAEIAACHRVLGLDVPFNIVSLPLDEQMLLTLGAWQNALPRLLVFDNCEDEALLVQWRPPTGGCRILLTSRRASWTLELGVHIVRLDVLARAESLALLRSHRPDLMPDDLMPIAEELGDLPLALHLAGSFLDTYQHTRLGVPATYLTHLREMALLQHPSLQGKGSSIYSATRHIQDVERTFSLSYEQLRTADPIDDLARALLARASYFASGVPISRDLLEDTLEQANQDDPLQDLLRADALNRLITSGLVETLQDGALRLHRLVAAFVHMQPEMIDPGAKPAVKRVLLEKAKRLNQAGYPRPMLALQPHLRALVNLTQQRIDAMTADLCNELALHLQMTGAYGEAQLYLERALAIREKVLGPEHPDTAEILNTVAELYAQLYSTHDKLTQAESLLMKALAIREKVLGSEHPDTARSLASLASLYRGEDKVTQAEPLYRRALAIREKVLGSEHPDTARSLADLASLYRGEDKVTQAEPLYRRALAIREKVLGSEHPDTEASIYDLASFYLDQGEYEQAEPLYQRALAICEKVFGPEHPAMVLDLLGFASFYHHQGKDAQAKLLCQRALIIHEKAFGSEHLYTAYILSSLAVFCIGQGEYEQAEPLCQRALAICEKVFRPESAISTILNDVAIVYFDQGKYEQAEPLYQRALAICEKVFGPEHSDTACCLNNLAYLYTMQGKYEQAEPLYQRALAICEKSLNPESPYTAYTLTQLANFYCNQSKYTKAEPLYRRALVIREKVLGPEHPDTVSSLVGLASLYTDQSKYNQAEPLLTKALAIREKVLGPENRYVAHSLNQLGLLYNAQGKYTLAELFYQRALTIREKVLGAEHPYTALSLYNLASVYRKQSKYTEAENLFLRSLAIREKVLGTEHSYTVDTRDELAHLYRTQGKYAEARALYQHTSNPGKKS